MNESVSLELNVVQLLPKIESFVLDIVIIIRINVLMAIGHLGKASFNLWNFIKYEFSSWSFSVDIICFRC